MAHSPRPVRILILGMNPSSCQKNTKNSTLRRLWDWADQIGLGIFSFSNVVLQTGKVHKNMVDRDVISYYGKIYDKIITLGNFPSEILTELNINHFKLPHPSGLNRLINDKEYIFVKLENCREFINK